MIDERLDMTDVRAAVPLFFEKGARRLFNSTIGRTLYRGPGGYYFVTSEQVKDGRVSFPRKWTVRQYIPGHYEGGEYIHSHIRTAGAGYQAYADPDTAATAAKLLAKGQ
jgi:hypothetical protein